MNAGKLRHRVAIQQDANHGTPANGGGPQDPSWTTIGTRYANVVPLSGRERFTAQQVQADITHRVEMHYDPDLGMSPMFRLVYDSRALEIESVINLGERNIEMHVMCKEVV